MVFRHRLNKVPRFVSNHLKISITTKVDFFINSAVMQSINEPGNFLIFQDRKKEASLDSPKEES